MTVFVLVEDYPEPKLAERVRKMYPQDHLEISDGKWLISDNNTTKGVCEKLGIVEDGRGFPGTIVFSTGSYYGLHDNVTWEWLKTKLESN